MKPHSRYTIKRQMDQLILSEWIGEGARVLDLGCGRGVFLDHLRHARKVYGVGVDTDADKIRDCVRRGLNAYQGDIIETLKQYQDGFFDWVVCSRTLQELNHPQEVTREALRVGRRLAVGFVNFGYWRNRLHLLRYGSRIKNEVYPENWWESRPLNPVSVNGFEDFCQQEGLSITRRAYLGSDWRSNCTFLPAWRSGYAVYEVSKQTTSGAAATEYAAASGNGTNTVTGGLPANKTDAKP